MVVLFFFIFINNCCLACNLSNKKNEKSDVRSHNSECSDNNVEEENIGLVDKFLNAQNNGVDGSTFDVALKEISDGKKVTCWMWYIFPIIEGLGYSEINRKYSIKNKEEAFEFLENDQLRDNLVKITKAVLNCRNYYPGKCVRDIFDGDDVKLFSSMTLFYIISKYLREKRIASFDDGCFYTSGIRGGSGECNIFKAVLDIYFNGKYCDETSKQVGQWLK